MFNQATAMFLIAATIENNKNASTKVELKKDTSKFLFSWNAEGIKNTNKTKFTLRVFINLACWDLTSLMRSKTRVLFTQRVAIGYVCGCGKISLLQFPSRTCYILWSCYGGLLFVLVDTSATNLQQQNVEKNVERNRCFNLFDNFYFYKKRPNLIICVDRLIY